MEQLGFVIQAAIGGIVAVVGFLLKRSIDANDKRLEGIGGDVKTLMGTLNTTTGDVRVLESQTRRLEDEVGALRKSHQELSSQQQNLIGRLESLDRRKAGT